MDDWPRAAAALWPGDACAGGKPRLGSRPGAIEQSTASETIAEGRMPSQAAALTEVAAVGFVTNANDPLLRVEACPGAPGCPSASLDTRGVGRLLATQLHGATFSGTVHISGCWKGCARSAPADLTLVAREEHYLVVRRGTASGTPIASLSPAEVRSSPSRLLDLVEDCAHV